MKKYAGTRTNGCDSKFEALIERLCCVKKNKDVRFDYTISHKYKPDFILKSGVIVEAKGWFKPSDRAKMRAVRDAFPDKKFVLVFQNAHAKCSGTKGTNADWAEKNGFEWSNGVIRKEWM